MRLCVLVNLLGFITSLMWPHHLLATQPYELKQHFYYKIEKAGKLIGYAEEYIHPFKEIPNLQVEIQARTVIGVAGVTTIPIRLERRECYRVDLTYDRLLNGEIERQDFLTGQHFCVKLDWQQFTLQPCDPAAGNPLTTKAIGRNMHLGYHRFLALPLENQPPPMSGQGKGSILWPDRGDITDGAWQVFPDTSLVVNGFRLRCHHLRLLDKLAQPERELWLLTNSYRLIRSYEFHGAYAIELADETFRNYLETPYDLTVKRALLQNVTLKISDTTAPTPQSLNAKRQEFGLKEVTVPFEERLPDSLTRYTEPIKSRLKLSVDSLFQTGVQLTRKKHYFDELLIAFTRWSIQRTEIYPLLKKRINDWTPTEQQQFIEALALFSRLCRAVDIPTRFIQGIFVVSVVEKVAYNWLWIEVSDGKQWYPWHLEFAQAPTGGAEFVRLSPLKWEAVKKLSLTSLPNVEIESYQFQTERTLLE